MKPYRLKLVRETDPSLPECKPRNASEAARFLRDHVFDSNDSWRESSYMLTLDRNHNITGIFHLSTGNPDKTTIDNHTAAIVAVQTGAFNVIIAHNHPSGNPMPTQYDIESTSKLKHALNALQIPLLDHIILGDECYYSVSDERKSTFN